MRSGEITQEYDQHLGPVNTITFVDENRRFITSSDDKTMRVWDFDIPVPIKLIADPTMHSMPAVGLHPNGKHSLFSNQGGRKGRNVDWSMLGSNRQVDGSYFTRQSNRLIRCRYLQTERALSPLPSLSFLSSSFTSDRLIAQETFCRSHDCRIRLWTPFLPRW